MKTIIMKMTALICLGFFLAINTNGQGKFSALKVGDKVPDVLLSNMRNYKNTNAKLSDFKGKLVIIDFWNRYCSVCIANFPKMEELQKQFGDKIQILLVNTEEGPEVLKDLFEKSYNVKNTKLPYVLGSKELRQLFPHGAEPFHVWIGPDGLVKAMPWFVSTTPENVEAFFHDKNFSLRVREDLMDYKESDPLILEGNGRQWNHLKSYSMLMSKIDNETVGMASVQSPITGKGVGIRLVHNSLYSLFKQAYSFAGPLITEENHLSNIDQPRDPNKQAEWRSKNLFSYELVLDEGPKEIYKRLNEFLRQDLERSFKVRGTIENRKMKCYIIYRKGELKSMVKGVGREDSFDRFLFVLKLKIAPKDNREFDLIIDETNYSGPIDLKLVSVDYDLASLKKELATYGLDIKEEERELPCLILRGL